MAGGQRRFGALSRGPIRSSLPDNQQPVYGLPGAGRESLAGRGKRDRGDAGDTLRRGQAVLRRAGIDLEGGGGGLRGFGRQPLARHRCGALLCESGPGLSRAGERFADRVHLFADLRPGGESLGGNGRRALSSAAHPVRELRAGGGFRAGDHALFRAERALGVGVCSGCLFVPGQWLGVHRLGRQTRRGQHGRVSRRPTVGRHRPSLLPFPPGKKRSGSGPRGRDAVLRRRGRGVDCHRRRSLLFGRGWDGQEGRVAIHGGHEPGNQLGGRVAYRNDPRGEPVDRVREINLLVAVHRGFSGHPRQQPGMGGPIVVAGLRGGARALAGRPLAGDRSGGGFGGNGRDQQPAGGSGEPLVGLQ